MMESSQNKEQMFQVVRHSEVLKHLVVVNQSVKYSCGRSLVMKTIPTSSCYFKVSLISIICVRCFLLTVEQLNQLSIHILDKTVFLIRS